MALMAKGPTIRIENVSLDFPVFNASGRSIKQHLASIATGGLLRKDKESFVEIRALDEISIALDEGDRLAVLGHNGAGKSTFLRLVSGVYEPQKGTVEVHGSLGSLIDVGLGINAESTGRENLYLRGAIMGMSKAQIKDIEDEVIEFSDLGEFIDLPVRTYSTGMQMRLAFAVSTVIRPDILLMDEWLSVGDENFKAKAEARISSLVSETKILVIATHSESLALKTCNKAIWLEHGRVVLQGSALEVCSKYFQ